MSDEKKNAWIEFFGKLITPITIIILVLSFKSTVEERLSQASEVSVLGSSFKFDTNSFHGQLSALELYYLIHASIVDAHPNFDLLSDQEKAAIYLLQSKELIVVNNMKSDIPGEFKEIVLQPSGLQLVQKLGLSN